MDQRVWDRLRDIDGLEKLKKKDGRKIKVDKFGQEVGFFQKGTTSHYLPHKKILSRLADGKALGEFDHSEIKTVDKIILATARFDPVTQAKARDIVNGRSFRGGNWIFLNDRVIADELVEHALGVASRNARWQQVSDVAFENNLAQMVYLNPGVDSDLFARLT